MASHLHGGGDGDEHEGHNPGASATRWRHQESSSFARHAVARDAESRSGVSDLADFLNSSRITDQEAKRESQRRMRGNNYTPITLPPGEGFHDAPVEDRPATTQESMTGTLADGTEEIAVGPLLNYRRMEAGRWVGSVLIVTTGGGGQVPPRVPTLVLTRVGTTGNQERPVNGPTDLTAIPGTCLYSDPRNTFWRFDLVITVEATETQWEYKFPDLRFASETKPQINYFHIPAASESMRIMFHSCNGFSVGTDEEAYCGACLWNDVARRHEERPLHVMIGGGDQIYNDGIRVHGPLRAWTDIGNPKKRRDYPFPDELRKACDDYYLKNYIGWYGTEPFAAMNGQIPQLNIWDDHDIIDGFGSYVSDFMKCDVFRGIGGTAHKYYMLFQHHLPPPRSTYTDAPATMGSGDGEDPVQLIDTFVAPEVIEPNYIIGSKPGPYVAERSHSMFARLGARIAFLGIDARTERTRHQVNYPETYDLIFSRLRTELGAAARTHTPYKHLILLLGIPIAYPRLTWLENVFTSPVIGPVKFLNKRFGLGGGLFNHFDGSVDLLDDLDDHYTARTHKKERNHLLERLQNICAEFSVRITILGGDVHLAALGRFYSNPRLNVPTEEDYRYMVNVVSSAIVNKPPPAAIANLLARRNKIHHLNSDTDETLLKLFDKDPGDSEKTAGHNHVTMPSRNFATLTENSPNNPASAVTVNVDRGNHAVPNGSLAPPGTSAGGSISNMSVRSQATGKDGHFPLHNGEMSAGTKHKAASSELHGRGNDGSLDIAIRVEIDQHDPEGRTQSYGLSVPVLNYNGPVPSTPVVPPATPYSE